MRPSPSSNSVIHPGGVVLAPGRMLSIAEVVGVSRGDGEHFAEVRLEGDWRARCQRSADYVRRLLDTVQGRDDEALASLVRDFFADGAPPSVATLLARPTNDSAATRALASRALVYGVTTGFGNNKDKALRSREDALRMQVNLLRSHAAGVGPPAPVEVVRAAILLRIRSFMEGCSGVRPELVEFLVELLNRRVHPWVPQQGSVGSSGDLCPLAHLFLCVIGEGLAWADGAAGAGRPPEADRRDAPLSAREALAQVGLSPLTHLEPKEGLALTNGTTFTTAYAALAVHDAEVLLGTANVGAAMSLQALLGGARALDAKIHRVRGHAGQQSAAAEILAFAQGGNLLDTSDDVQDAYSLRCAPQVHGAATTAIRHAAEAVAQEINAVTDNPLLFVDESGGDAGDTAPVDGFARCIFQAYSGGNFHGEPVGMVMDYLKIAVAELASISERRTQHLLDRHHNRGLPANLAADPASGLNSGLMIAQYTAAALVSENKTLAHPATVDSIPTSANTEDHVAMAPIAARHARQIIDNTRHVLAIELLCAVEALEHRCAEHAAGGSSARLSPAAAAVLRLVRGGSEGVAPAATLTDDDLLWPRIAVVAAHVASGAAIQAARAAVAPG
ncbi:MAG: Histidine ammonia-lyase [Phycisphaerae bacterium]|nr:Histidine ammonia-lyase [Phycisphaerae bacterium]